MFWRPVVTGIMDRTGFRRRAGPAGRVSGNAAVARHRTSSFSWRFPDVQKFSGREYTATRATRLTGMFAAWHNVFTSAEDPSRPRVARFPWMWSCEGMRS